MKIVHVGEAQCFAHDDVRDLYASVNVDPEPNYPEQRVMLAIPMLRTHASEDDIGVALDAANADTTAIALVEGAARARDALGEPAIDPIPVLFFDDDGEGPSELGVRIDNLDRMGRAGDHLGMKIGAVAGGSIMHAGVLGGFMVTREGALELWRAIGRWLAAHPERKA